jgi:hypothetical protein
MGALGFGSETLSAVDGSLVGPLMQPLKTIRINDIAAGFFIRFKVD